MDLDFSGYLYVVFALVFVLALIALIATLARRFGLGYSGGSKSAGARRLSISEVLTLPIRLSPTPTICSVHPFS